MKKLLIILLIIPIFVCSQTTEELDFIGPFNDGLVAVKKGDSWGFINDKGNIVIAFRNDLVLTETDGFKYPIFKNNRCLITQKKADISYFGYIDKTGKTVIEPQFLNATNFNNNYALALELRAENIGKNELLDKNIVYYKYFEVTIDTEGNIKDYLNPKGVNIALNKRGLKPPKINSRFISNDLLTTMNENKKWIIKTINP
jgi:hypothetical protein